MLRIDLYTDVICPWCLIGQRRLDNVLTEHSPKLVVDIRHHPVLLMPDVPAAGLFIADLLRVRHGVPDPKTAFARVEAEARASGLDLDLRRQPLAYPTQSAHALILAARERGTQHVLAVAISEAYFLHARNIADAEVLATIAADHGFDRAEARAIALDPAQRKRIELEAAKSAAAGVRSIPHLVLGGRIAINGGRSEDEIAACILEASGAAEVG